MKEVNQGRSLFGAAIAFVLAIILMSSAQAFPLYGGNGIVNATVYGVMKYEYGDGLYVDISANDTDIYDIELIDNDNNTYNDNSGPYRSTLHGFPTEAWYKGSIRDMLLFDVPKDIIINRLRIMPTHSDPFYINWTGMPKATSRNETLRFYGATYEPNGMRWRQGNWNLDLSITNSANQTAEFNSSSFALMDQFGWVYSGEEDDTLKTIPAGESLRFNVKVPFVSEKSSPMAILFKGMKLDIATWA
ncbi:MAG: hypothetical protein PHS80_04955 [Methanothrix sp.]|nr:hypothetical protein [Methanothrix sp.]MDD4447590.1 hypothetical protein [Methanothrix sp.]